MIAYAESSAVLSWLLHEPGEEVVRRHFASAERVIASSLTTLECARALRRGVQTGRLDQADASAAQKLLDAASASWALVAMTDVVLDRARLPFPVEPVRTLDAVHLATARLTADAYADLAVVSLDDRVRNNATALGLAVLP
ncbi:MAG: type II toxin-antitoxin system VapC family toxin [Gemmatimonadales bacterium]